MLSSRWLSTACAVSTSACLSRARAESRLAVALSSACFDATWRLARSARRSYSASACFNVACAPASAARACSSLSLYGPGFRGFMAENAATPAYG